VSVSTIFLRKKIFFRGLFCPFLLVEQQRDSCVDLALLHISQDSPAATEFPVFIQSCFLFLKIRGSRAQAI